MIIIGDIHKEDFQFKHLNSTLNSITVGWKLNARAQSMKKANFIRNYQYIIHNKTVYTSMDETYEFYNLSSASLYTITGVVVTDDNMSPINISLDLATLSG